MTFSEILRNLLRLLQRDLPNLWRNQLSQLWRDLLNPTYPPNPAWRDKVRLRKKLLSFRPQRKPTSLLLHPHLDETTPPTLG